MQQYITKSKKGMRRPTKAYEKIISGVPEVIEESLGKFFTAGVTINEAKLGDVPHLYSLIPLAQSVAAPIHGLKPSDGLVGAQYSQHEEYGKIIAAVCEKIARNMGIKV